MANIGIDNRPQNGDSAAPARGPEEESVSTDQGVREAERSPSGITRSGVRVHAVDGPLPRVYLVLVCAVTVGGLLLRLTAFQSSLSGDEISTLYIVHGHSLARALSLVYSRQETTPPLYFILAWLTQGWLGNSAESLRLVPLVTGVAAIPMTFVLGLWTVGRRAALIGAFCVACSPFMIYFSTDARTYMLVLFFGLSSSLCLLRAIGTSRVIWWVGYAASTCAAAYSHYSVVFFLVPQLVWAFYVAPRARKQLIISNVAAIVAFLPWLPGFRADLHQPNLIKYFLPVNAHTVWTVLQDFWIGSPVIPVSHLPGNFAVDLAIAGLAVGACGLALEAVRRRPLHWTFSTGVALIAVLAVVPAVLMILYSLHTDVLGAGNIIASWPALGLAMGAIVTASPNRFLRLAAMALLVGAYVIGGTGMLRSSYQAPNVDAAMAFINSTGKSGDPIVSAPFFSNPLSEVDAALVDTPSWTYIPGNTLDHARPATPADPHPVIRLSGAPWASPPLDEQFHFLAAPNPRPVFGPLPAPTPRQVASEAQSLARNGTVFLVTPYGIDVPLIVTRYPHVGFSQFVRAMEPRYHIVRQVSYSFDIGVETIYVFHETKPARK